DGVLRMRMDSYEATEDAKRIHALLLAMYDRNKRLLDQRDNAQHDLKRIEADIAGRNNEIARLQAQLEQYTRQGARPLTEPELVAMRSRVNDLEGRWRSADEQAKNLQGELERMREAASRVASTGAPGEKIAVEDGTLK